MKKSIYNICVLLPLFCTTVMLSACNKLEIHAGFGVQSKAVRTSGTIRTVEIQFQINQEWRYDGAIYYIKFIPKQGSGTLRLEDNAQPMQINTRYKLGSKNFKIIHTSAWGNMERFDVYVTDNLNNERKVSYNFEPEIIGPPPVDEK